MPETLITPTPERHQHDDIDVRPAGRNNNAQVYVKPFWHNDRWKKVLDEKQRQAADMFVEDHEQLNRGTRSCLASLDRIDHAGGPILAETESGARQRIDDVRASLGPVGYNLIYCTLIYGTKPTTVTGKHNQVAQGMVVMALEVMAQTYGLRS
jgi:hypothetical protein